MTQIYALSYNNFREDYGLTSNNTNPVYKSHSLEMERQEYALKSEQRKLFFMNILNNTATAGSWILCLLQGIGAIIGCLAIISIY